MLTINQKIQTAITHGRWYPAKKDGKLTNFKPEKGMTIVLEDGEIGTVLKTPNSVGDFLIEVEGERRRINLVVKEITGYIRNV